MKFTNLKIGARMGIGYAVILALMLGLVAIGLNNASNIQHDLDHVAHSNVRKMELLQQMSSSVHVVSRVIRTMVLLKDDTAREHEYKKVEEARSKYDDAWEELQKMPSTEAGRALRLKMQQYQQLSRPAEDRVIADARKQRVDDAVQTLMTQSIPATAQWQEAIQENIDLQQKNDDNDVTAAHDTYVNARAWILILAGIAILIGGGLGWWITRSITKPLRKAVTIAETVASGDLTSRIEVGSEDETGQLLRALQNMNASLVQIVSQVHQGTGIIASASGQIASGNMDLSSRTESQASSLEETASSMEELTATVKQNADNARQANTLAVSASEVAMKGGAVVADVVHTMGSINESAKKIVDIISVIDGIAFQTNILALNAAVEAARAGEQGRGFAVVASEVRSLAQRSASAAKEIKTLIGDSVEKVESGTRLVDQAGETMQEIVEGIRRVTDIMGEITAASHEQTSGIEQINMAVSQMDEATQQNAALVEEAAAAAQSLQDQAKNLLQMVSVFKLTDGTAVSADISAIHSTIIPIVKSGKRKQATSSAVSTVRRIPAARITNGGDWEEF